MDTLPIIWNTYVSGDYRTALQQSAQAFVDVAGIDLLHLIGMSLINLHRPDEGMLLLKAATTLRPQSAHIYINAAHLAEQCSAYDDAMYFTEIGLIDFPDEPDLMLIAANCLVMKARFDEARPIYQKILDRNPTHVQCLINLGNIARAYDDFDGAERMFRKAEALDPDFRDLIFARATMYSQQNRTLEAISVLEPLSEDIDARFLLALLYLANGDYERGWLYYRSRSKAIWYRNQLDVVPLSFDHWSEARGKNIAIVHEAGYGDMLQFMRYIPPVADIVQSMTMFVPPSLIRLLQHSLPSNIIFQSSRNARDHDSFDYVTTELEFPFHFRTTIDTVPNDIPYIKVPIEAILDHPLPPTDKRRVGLCWAGGTNNEYNQRSYDIRRSLELSQLAALGEIPGIEFVSLQLGDPSKQVGFPMLRPLEEDFDFLDTAAIIAQLDLVISVDTSVVHLAAGMGKPTWLLSRYDCCWRWLFNQQNNPWYPNVRIFGQRSYRDWSQPLAELPQALDDWMNHV